MDDLYLGRANGSFTRFLQLENSLANGIYYYTDRTSPDSGRSTNGRGPLQGWPRK